MDEARSARKDDMEAALRRILGDNDNVVAPPIAAPVFDLRGATHFSITIVHKGTGKAGK